MLVNRTVGIIGVEGGAETILQGLLASAMTAPSDLICSHHSHDVLDRLHRRWGVRTSPDHQALATVADIIMICVRPEETVEVIAEIAPTLGYGALLVSVVPGVALATLESKLPQGVPVARAMPTRSYPALGGLSVYALGETASASEAAQVEAVLGTIGRVLRVTERDMAAVTALWDSGPTALWRLVEVLTQAGMALDLPLEVARSFSTQAVAEAATLLVNGHQDPVALRREYKASNGAAEAASDVLEGRQLEAILVEAVIAAREATMAVERGQC